jgi:tRNA G10  N-methylase Trm11
MTMKPEALAKLEKSNKIKEQAKKIIELDEKIKEIDTLKEKKSEIVSEIVELLGEELVKEKTMHFDFPELNKRVIIEGRDEKTFPPEIDAKIKKEMESVKNNVEQIKEIAKINHLIVLERSYFAKVTKMTKPKE